MKVIISFIKLLFLNRSFYFYICVTYSNIFTNKVIYKYMSTCDIPKITFQVYSVTH